ncbi:MAG: type II toxin-antitoxin system prevent-host-death family antitoxin, partial [Psychrosphaera sp.]|nr:type II toxin-antitoxin system prevent-host-death family antitoxin [Psychrosphaera sp.]
MRIETISFLRKNVANLNLEQPLVITQNGTPSFVIESYEDAKRRDCAVALLKLTAFSIEDERQGNTSSSE